ncbi:MAG: type II toxin-antitoxin system HicA family toxin [Cyanobacteriota bacterium]
MKRRALLQHLIKNNCQIVREGRSHSILENTANQRLTSVPRKIEIPTFTVCKICRHLEIPEP